MSNPREKGKIPHSEWPEIQVRYGKGESLASIARDYRCTAPAIRYIVKRRLALGDGEGDRRPSASGAPREAHAAPEPAERKSAPVRPPPRLSGITLEVQKRVTTEISFFLVALDIALTHPTNANLLALHDATDRLMRAAARVRIETERSVGADAGEHLAGTAQHIS
jgi:hypothetical protein